MTIKTHAGFETSDLAVVVVRTPPSHKRFASAEQCIQTLVKKGYAVWVFLQGPAVGLWCTNPPTSWTALQTHPQVDICLCQAAWQRLGLQDQQPAFATSTLIQAWMQMTKASTIHAIGLGTWPKDWGPMPAPDASDRFGVMVAYAPTSKDATSQLEWVLAASTLELDVALAFGENNNASNPRWAQVFDHQLAKVITEANDPAIADRVWMVL